MRHVARPFGLALGLVASVLGLAGCLGKSPTLGSLAGAPEPSVPARAKAGYGRITLTIRWPRRSVQYIPGNTAYIEFQILTTAGSLLRTTTANAPASGGAVSVSFSGLPAGNVLLSGNAKDANGNILSSGTIQVHVVANASTAASLVLSSTQSPAITSFWPPNGDPGATVNIFGSGFGASRNASFSVSLGGVVLPNASLTRIDDSLIAFKVPDTATNSAVVVQVDSLATQSASVFSTIRSWQVSPSSANLFVPNGVQAFSASAFDWQGASIASASVTWSVTALSGDAPSIDLNGNLTAGMLPGQYQIKIGNGASALSVPVSTHVMTLADFVGPQAQATFQGQLGTRSAVVDPTGYASNAAAVTLGKELFFDTRLGSNAAMACVTCHQPRLGLGDGQATAITNSGGHQARNSMTLWNVGYHPLLFWDGRSTTLENQVDSVFANAQELNRSESSLDSVLNAASYPASYSAVFGSVNSSVNSGANLANTALAIAAFERTLVTQDSAYDLWAKGANGLNGTTSALSDAQRRGLAVFATTGKCIQCHNGPNFTDEQFHNIAIQEAGGALSPGRMGVTSNAADLGSFKVPTLRNVTETGPYFHNGSITNLTDAILHYESDFSASPNIDPILSDPIFLTGQQRSDLIAFLSALTGATPSLTP